MKRKMMSVMMILIMAVTLLSGCVSKEENNSTFFQEAKKLSNIKNGTETVEIGYMLDSDLPGFPKQLLTEDGKADLKIKMEATAESETKQAIKISAKLGKNEYQNVTTVVMNGSTLYLDVRSIVDFVGTIDESIVPDIETILGQMGITGTISLDLKKFAEASGQNLPEFGKFKTESTKLTDDILNKLDQSFKDIQGKDGDSYTVSVNEKNADQAVDALVSFCEQNLESIFDESLDCLIALYGEDSQVGQQCQSMKQDHSDVKDAVQKIKTNRDSMVNAVKDSKADIVGKISIAGDEGEREGTLTFDTGDITIEQDGDSITGNITLDAAVKEESVQIDQLIPEDAADLTTLLITYMNQMGILNSQSNE